MGVVLIQAGELNGPWLSYGLTDLPLTISNVSIIIRLKCLILDSLNSL